MALFAVSYELRHASEAARRRICNEIERLGGVEALERVYLIELDGTADEVRDHLLRFLASGDRLLVIAFDAPPVAASPLVGTEAWVMERFASSTLAR